jgi:hypothetical protein
VATVATSWSRNCLRGRSASSPGAGLIFTSPKSSPPTSQGWLRIELERRHTGKTGTEKTRQEPAKQSNSPRTGALDQIWIERPGASMTPRADDASVFDWLAAILAVHDCSHLRFQGSNYQKGVSFPARGDLLGQEENPLERRKREK